MNQAMLSISHFSLSPPPSHQYYLLPRQLCSFSNPKPTTYLKAPNHICQGLTTDEGRLVRERRTNYYDSLWDYNQMKSLTNGFEEAEEYGEELEKIKEEVKAQIIMAKQEEPLVKLELIDTVQQLGLHYHFEAEIQDALDLLHKRENDYSRLCNDLNGTPLRFRLLRKHGYKVPQDVFKSFMGEARKFRAIARRCGGPVESLYEASFLGLDGETIIDEAMEFSSSCLKAMEESELPKSLAIRVDRALSMPRHWRCNRLQARWFVNVYKEEPDMNPNFLNLAKLDFNIVQSIHVKEVREVSRYRD